MPAPVTPPHQRRQTLSKDLEEAGRRGTPGIENQYCAARAGLAEAWNEKVGSTASRCRISAKPLEDSSRLDLSALPFVSIDAARTVDIDDALHAEVTTNGWQLSVAVADPTAYLADVEGLPALLADRGHPCTSTATSFRCYPRPISQGLCALAEDVPRPAVVCQMQISESGEIEGFEFHKAIIRSHAKLAYSAVDRYVTGNSDDLIAHANPLEALVQVYRTLRERREQHELVMEERREYRWILGEDKQISEIDGYDKLASQHLVEECMIAANKCAARFLRDAAAPGPFVVHQGFRADRTEEATTFLEKHRADLKDTALNTLEGYRAILADLGQKEHELPLRGHGQSPAVSRHTERSSRDRIWVLPPRPTPTSHRHCAKRSTFLCICKFRPAWQGKKPPTTRLSSCRLLPAPSAAVARPSRRQTDA